MSKYDYDAIGFHRSYESYVKVREEHPVEGMVIPTKEEYESKRDADFEHGIKVRKAKNMICSLQNVLTEDIDLLMQVYDVVAPILNLKSTEEVTEEVILEWKKKHLYGTTQDSKEAIQRGVQQGQWFCMPDFRRSYGANCENQRAQRRIERRITEMARGPIKTTQQKIEETEKQLAMLKQLLEVEDIQSKCALLIKRCTNKEKLQQVLDILTDGKDFMEFQGKEI